MAKLLFIDTSSKNCSALIADDGQVIAERFEANTRSHAQLLPVFIDELFQQTKLERSELSALVVSAGPGSYTGVRIGMSVAKGMCFTLDLPLIALDSLSCMAEGMIDITTENDAVYIATMDSRKGEIYYAAMDDKGQILSPSQPAVVKDLTWDKWIGKKVFIAGNTKDKLQDSPCSLILTRLPIDYSAKNYIKSAFERFEKGIFDDLVYKEPNYLKPFQ